VPSVATVRALIFITTPVAWVNRGSTRDTRIQKSLTQRTQRMRRRGETFDLSENGEGRTVGEVRHSVFRNPRSLDRANLIPDAQLVAMAIENGFILCSNDGHFNRFPGLQWVNPLS
jgi:hypothetical protein